MHLVEMPHALKFLRRDSSDVNHKRPEKKSLRSSSGQGPRPVLKERSSSSHSAKSNTSEKEDMNYLKRSALARSAVQRPIPQEQPAKISILIESPPAVFIGPSATSTGALVSGQLRLSVLEDKLKIKSIQLKLEISVRQKKPFHQHCADCAQQTIELDSWNFLTHDTEFAKGDHDIPFSQHLEGHLPITMYGRLSVIDYVWKAVVTPITHAPMFLQQELIVKRAIIPQGYPDHLPKESIRIFPPTNLTAHAQLPPIIHPIGVNQCSFRLNGAITQNSETKTQTHWKIKRITWRLEETQKVISPACAKHMPKPGPDGTQERKGMAHTETRLLNSEELKSGWKCDYSAGVHGAIEMMFDFSIRGDTEPLCDVKAEDGTEISHSLIVEMIVAEEFAPTKKPQNSTPTGSARVLRMHFNQTVTERAGLGLSWDEEQPPLYENIDNAPPIYKVPSSIHLANAVREARQPARQAMAGHRTPHVGAVERYEGPPIPEYAELDSMVEPSSSAPTSEIGSIVGSYSEPVRDLPVTTLSSRNLSSMGSFSGNSPRMGTMGAYWGVTPRNNRPAIPQTYNSGRSLFDLGDDDEEEAGPSGTNAA